jgi:hypothetical protein
MEQLLYSKARGTRSYTLSSLYMFGIVVADQALPTHLKFGVEDCRLIKVRAG